MGDNFIWAAAGPKDRADMIRSHRNLPLALLCDLFCFTEKGAGTILNGDDWKSEYAVCE